ncbi:MAG: dUTP diphosphatase [Patescibacteria group bacterium]
MNTYSGKLIVIDGTDGSGKTTQLNLLKTRLENEGYEVMVADFPQYNQKSAGLVEEYLSGKYGQADEITPYQASIFYAVDRYDASAKIRNWLQNGKIVLANRYTSANMGHQGGKIDNPLERKAFFNWLYDLEYKLFNIPKPDLSLILHVEAEISQKLAHDRARTDWSGSKADIHENNLDHLKKAERVYVEIADSYPEFQLISCTKNNEILSRDEISLLVWIMVKRIIISSSSIQKDFRAISDIISTNPQIINNRDIIFDSNQSKKENYQAETNIPVNYHTEEKTILNSTSSIKSDVPKLLIEKLYPEAKLPQKAHLGDAGFDLYSNDYYSIAPYSQSLVSTGIKLAIPLGYVGLIWDKSGIAFEGIKTMGGVIDSNYRGEIKVIVKNLSEEMYNIIPGQKIAQILIQAISEIEIKEQKIVDETERDASGFGSTGKF